MNKLCSAAQYKKEALGRFFFFLRRCGEGFGDDFMSNTQRQEEKSFSHLLEQYNEAITFSESCGFCLISLPQSVLWLVFF